MGSGDCHIKDGRFCCNTEILEELNSVPGDVGACIQACAGSMCFEVGDDGWPWQEYVEHVDRMRVTYEAVISEYNGNRKRTVGLNDISIIALAKTLGLPLVSMEKPNTFQPSMKRMRIPDVCQKEDMRHYTFNEFLRAEGIRL